MRLFPERSKIHYGYQVLKVAMGRLVLRSIRQELADEVNTVSNLYKRERDYY